MPGAIFCVPGVGSPSARIASPVAAPRMALPATDPGIIHKEGEKVRLVWATMSQEYEQNTFPPQGEQGFEIRGPTMC